jgi:hypothetical protein
MVSETRVVTFKKGANPLQFSWANTLIDPSSVELRFLTGAEKLDVLDTTFPHDKPQMLYWNVQSDFDGEATIEITYFTSGITWAADYVAIADKDEQAVRFDGFVRVTNHSGEEYEDAKVRLIVGTINLVEKIAQLAQIPMQEVERMDKDRRRELSDVAARGMMKQFGAMGGAAPTAAAAPMPEEKQIIKEGLSEYFVFSIDGTETIPNGWSKRMRAIEAKDVPLKIRYRYRVPEYGEQLVRMYLMTNDTASKLGDTPLPDGVVRVFRDSGREGGGLSYVTQQPIKYVPIGDKIELNLGRDPEVVFELLKKKSSRDNIWVQIHGADVFRRVDQPGVEVDVNSTVVGWDDREVYVQRVRNYTRKPIDLEIRRALPGHVVFRSALEPTLHDYQTVQLTASAEPGEKLELPFEVIRKQGRNAKQGNVTLEAAEIRP